MDKRYNPQKENRKSRRCRSPENWPAETRKRTKSSHEPFPSSSKDVPKHESNFSFELHKYELNKVIAGQDRFHLINNTDDFWLFLRKYETLKKRGNALPRAKEENPNLTQVEIPDSYKQEYEKKIKQLTYTDQLFARIPFQEFSHRKSKLTFSQFIDFLDIVKHYLNFKLREYISKIKKLRDSQRSLPVAQFREEIVDAVKNKRVVIIAGDTGCGKSTQIPQYLIEAGFKSIVCTQPRRIACISLAKRVAYETCSENENKVGYQIRFEKSKNKNTNILFITEGLLLRQVASEKMVEEYDVIVLDEVHERHLHGDFLLGVVKCLIHQRSELKIVLMSATINIDLFSQYFSTEDAQVIQVPGRLYPITMHYRPILRDIKQSKTERLDPSPYLQIMQLIDEKYPKTEKGDLLIFLSGTSEITAVVDAAKEYSRQHENWIVLPLYSSLSLAEQDKVFDYPPEGVRKCIVSTNIAETSVTIDGIRFVADSGKVKEMSYDPICRMQRLKEFWISRASAEQRKGRAGRTGPGVCYRLFSEEEYKSLAQYSTPELQRVPLDSLLLQMIAMGLPDARQFPFIEPPAKEHIENAILTLKHNGAITENEKITTVGSALSRLPVDIVLGKMLIVGSVLHQVESVLSIVAALSVQTPFTNKAYRDLDCQAALKSLESDHGDSITLLNAYREWLTMKQQETRNGESRQWCRRRGLEEQRFYEIIKLRRQFKDLLQDCGLLDIRDPETQTSEERKIRNGELRQLRAMRRAHKHAGPRKNKELKLDLFDIGDLEDKIDEDDVDIKDIEFRLSHDGSKVQKLLSSATVCSYKDITILKLILGCGLYPQIAVADEFNYCKSSSEQLFHTGSKAFVALHPLSYFGNHPEVLQLQEPEIEVPPDGYYSKRPLSGKHQMLCYLSLLETTKPYLVNTIRMPTAQTLLLFAHTIETSSAFTQIVCDSWLLLEFPTPESGQILLSRAVKLRHKWDTLLSDRLLLITNDAKTDPPVKKSPPATTEYELEQDLIAYMRTEISYTVHRLLAADLKTIYIGNGENYEEIDPNPFVHGFVCTPYKKGGVQVTENVFYNCLIESDWSVQVANLMAQMPWTCNGCAIEYCFTSIQKLQHLEFCEARCQLKIKSNEAPSVNYVEGGSNRKMYECLVCGEKLQLTPTEILKHKKLHIDK